MSPILYFAVKFFPFWGPIVAITSLPMAVRLFKRRSLFAGLSMLVFIGGLGYLTYLYIAFDGYNRAVPIILKWLE
jgi:hypothetical protein